MRRQSEDARHRTAGERSEPRSEARNSPASVTKVHVRVYTGASSEQNLVWSESKGD